MRSFYKRPTTPLLTHASVRARAHTHTHTHTHTHVYICTSRIDATKLLISEADGGGEGPCDKAAEEEE